MDVYLSHEAVAQMDTIALVSSRGEGLLIGHTRGGRFFIESLFPAIRVASISTERLLRLMQRLGETFLGFFSYDRSRPKPFTKMEPALTGKIFLEVTGELESGLRMQAFLCDYDGEFRRIPLPHHVEKQSGGYPHERS
jgi:hypothetical protein